MRKEKGRNTALFLVFCMVLSMFSAIPARAEGDGDESQEELCGLLAVEWLGRDGENDGEVRVKNNHPVDPEGNPISYTDYKDVSIPGAALWIDYKDTDGTPVPVSADQLTVKYFAEEDPREEGTSEGSDTGSIVDYTVQTSEGERTLVLFEPDGLGYYSFSYNQCETDDLTVYVGYPEIGIYSKDEQDVDYLYPANDWVEEQSFNYTGLKGENDNKIYVNLYNRYEADSIKLTEYTLSLWDEEGTELNSESDKDKFEKYMSVKQMTDKLGWYEITFNEALSSEDGFGLSINGEKDGDPIGAYLEGSFQQSGLYVTWDGEYRCNGENVMYYPGGLNPEAAKLRFGKFVKDKKTGKVTDEFLGLQEEKIQIEAGYVDYENGFKWTEKGDAAKDDCEWELTNEGFLKIKSYYQQDYKITVGTEGSVYVHPYMETIEFFTDKVRPADPERITRRIRTIKVNEGKPATVYVLAYSDAEDAYSADMNNPEIKAILKDGKTEVTETYIKRGEKFTDKDGNPGYPIEITAQAKEDFYITVTANGPVQDENGELLEHKNTLSVDINKRSTLKVTAPLKTTYTEGDMFDPTGMAVELVYADGTTEPLKEGYTVTPAGPLTTADTSVTVSYLELTTPLPITVSPKAPETPQTPPTAQPSAEGTVLSSQETGEKAEFTVTSDDSADPTVAYKGTTEKKEKSVKIPDKVVVNGITYKVTSIADNAFKGNKTITKVTVSSNITSIGKNAFANCKKLKTVTVSGNVTTVGDNAFKGCAALTKVTLPAKTKKIGNNAFSGCKKLKTLTIKSKKLTSKNISKNAFKGITSKTTIKVPASKVAAYKKLFKKKGLAKNVKVTR